MPKKAWADFAEIIASTAVWALPSVPFLKPTGIESPLAIWRCVWLSVVRAPMVDQQTRSARYCGTIGSRNSVPVNTPISAMERINRRAVRNPSSMSKVSLRRGS